MADIDINFYYQDTVQAGRPTSFSDNPFSPGTVLTGTLTGLTPDQVVWLKEQGKTCTFIRLAADPQQECPAVQIVNQEKQISLEERIAWLEKRVEKLERQ